MNVSERIITDGHRRQPVPVLNTINPVRGSIMPEFDSTVSYRDVPGYPGYKVGSDGTVWSAWTSKRLGYGKGNRHFIGAKWTERKLIVAKGYLRATLQQHGRPKHFQVHHLVLIAFIGKRPRGKEALHANDIKTDCRLENLRWGTKKENWDDRRKNGRVRPARGESQGGSKLTEHDVLMIRSLYKGNRKGPTLAELAVRFSVSKSAISLIVRRDRWKHLA